MGQLDQYQNYKYMIHKENVNNYYLTSADVIMCYYPFIIKIFKANIIFYEYNQKTRISLTTY